MKNTVVIPIPSCHVRKTQTSCDCPSKVFYINYYMSSKQSFAGIKTIDLYNQYSITLKPYEKMILYFEETIITSLPATCILYGSQFLYKLGISYKVNLLQTNDTYLNIIIFNHTPKTLNFEPNSLNFICTIILNGFSF
jgi:hypothetical protein